MNLIEHGRRVLRTEAEALERLSRSLDERFDEAVELLQELKGKLN